MSQAVNIGTLTASAWQRRISNPKTCSDLITSILLFFLRTPSSFLTSPCNPNIYPAIPGSGSYIAEYPTMPPYSSAQKHSIAQFLGLTEAKDVLAAKFLRASGWDVEEAVNLYFASPHGSSSGNAASINKIFDKYRDDPVENPNGIGIERAIQYLGDIQVQLDEVTCLAIAELLKCPSMGEFTREGFVNGWRVSNCDTLPQMAEHAQLLRVSIPSDPAIFRRVYRYAFPLSRMQGQRNLQFEIAAEQWHLFFTPDRGGVQWNTVTTPWLDWWIEFLESRGKKPVNKDLWEQAEVFMRKTLEDEDFSWWSADGAWPGTLDDFVAWVQKKRGKPWEMEVE
ncbi:hypothetical protein NUU61_004405 [Penicillium alfredii]|uniref:Defective in cullin neddylation protein n=1 Tax=Penicillium alfredii TaxID=1506179 RepID=A0A9W9FL76_9EURO|nr:uncharacterized protein NUU61_004405 [Penicillium alfredii]KAJ5102183.1 hypothetical protein NUU61_004405 [Penicillium alfredii]